MDKRNLTVEIIPVNSDKITHRLVVDDGWMRVDGIVYARDGHADIRNASKGGDGKWYAKVRAKDFLTKNLNWLVSQYKGDVKTIVQATICSDEWTKPEILGVHKEAKVAVASATSASVASEVSVEEALGM